MSSPASLPYFCGYSSLSNCNTASESTPGNNIICNDAGSPNEFLFVDPTVTEYCTKGRFYTDDLNSKICEIAEFPCKIINRPDQTPLDVWKNSKLNEVSFNEATYMFVGNCVSPDVCTAQFTIDLEAMKDHGGIYPKGSKLTPYANDVYPPIDIDNYSQDHCEKSYYMYGATDKKSITFLNPSWNGFSCDYTMSTISISSNDTVSFFNSLTANACYTISNDFSFMYDSSMVSMYPLGYCDSSNGLQKISAYLYYKQNNRIPYPYGALPMSGSTSLAYGGAPGVGLYLTSGGTFPCEEYDDIVLYNHVFVDTTNGNALTLGFNQNEMVTCDNALKSCVDYNTCFVPVMPSFPYIRYTQSTTTTTTTTTTTLASTSSTTTINSASGSTVKYPVLTGTQQTPAESDVSLNTVVTIPTTSSSSYDSNNNQYYSDDYVRTSSYGDNDLSVIYGWDSTSNYEQNSDGDKAVSSGAGNIEYASHNSELISDFDANNNTRSGYRSSQAGASAIGFLGVYTGQSASVFVDSLQKSSRISASTDPSAPASPSGVGDCTGRIARLVDLPEECIDAPRRINAEASNSVTLTIKCSILIISFIIIDWW